MRSLTRQLLYLLLAVALSACGGNGPPPLQVTRIEPAAGSSNIERDAAVTVHFDRAATGPTAAALGEEALRLEGPDSIVVPVALSVSADRRTYTLRPVDPLGAGATYRLRVTTAMLADDGAPLAAEVTAEFTVRDFTWSAAQYLQLPEPGAWILDLDSAQPDGALIVFAIHPLSGNQTLSARRFIQQAASGAAGSH